MAEKSISFAADIRPLFRDRDVSAMKRIRNIDLSSYADVSARAEDILERLQAGDMPCDEGWPQERVELFAGWISDGKQL